MNSLDDDVRIKALLNRLHAASDAQNPQIAVHVAAHDRKTADGAAQDLLQGRDFWRDKLVALEPDKARFCYLLCRSLAARNIVEAGTSFGVSSLYLAAALRDNGGGKLIATEYEEAKTHIARRHFAEAGLADYIELRQGDLLETLKIIDEPIDFLLLDIWTPLALPALRLVGPRMRRGALAVTDNTSSYRQAYGEYLAYLNDPVNGFITQTLPFAGGLELSVKVA